MQAAKTNVDRNTRKHNHSSMVFEDWRCEQSLLLKLIDLIHIVEPHKRCVRGTLGLGLHRMDLAGIYRTLEPWSVQGMHVLINSHSIACNVHVACSSLLLSVHTCGRILDASFACMPPSH